MKKLIFSLILIVVSISASAYSIPGKMLRFVGSDNSGSAKCEAYMGKVLLNNTPKVVIDSLRHYADIEYYYYQLTFYVDIDVSTLAGKSLVKAIADNTDLEIVQLGYKGSERKTSVYAVSSVETSKKAKPGHTKMIIHINFSHFGDDDDRNFRDFWHYPIKSFTWKKSNKTLSVPKVDAEAITDAIAKMMIVNANDYYGFVNDWTLYPRNKESLNIYFKHYKLPFMFVEQSQIAFPPSSDKTIFRNDYKNIPLLQLLTKPFLCCTFNMTPTQMQATLKKNGYKSNVYDCEFFQSISVTGNFSSQGYQISEFIYTTIKDTKEKLYTITLQNPDWQDGNNVIDERAAVLKIVARLREMGIKMYPGDRSPISYGQTNLDRGWYVGAMGKNRLCVGYKQFTYSLNNESEQHVGCDIEIALETP